MGILGGHVRKDNLVTRLQTFDDFYCGHRNAAEFHLHTGGVLPVRLEFEQSDEAVGLPLNGSLDIHHIREPLEFYDAIDAQIGPSPGRKLSCHCLLYTSPSPRDS